MCYKTIDNYSCGDKEEATIPCEGFIDNGTCTQDEQAKQDKIFSHDDKCPECQHFDNEMKKLAENPDLHKPVEKSASKPHDGPKLYFKECTKWERCGHISHPKDTNIEREPNDPEYFEIPGQGSCWECAAAHPSKIEEMKRNGQYDLPDPWGAMNAAPEAAAGSSSEGMLNEHSGSAASSAPELKAPQPRVIPMDEIEEADDSLYGLSPADKARQAGYATGAPASFGQSRTPSPTPKKKGKGRAGMPEDDYASRYGAAPEPEDEPEFSGDEDDMKQAAFRGRSAARTHSRDSSMDANVHGRDRSYSSSEDDLDSGAAGNDIEVSPQERAKYGIPATMRLTEESFTRFKLKREAANQEAMRRLHDGLDD